MPLFVLIVFVGLLIVGLYLQELEWRHVGWLLVIVVVVFVIVGVFRLPSLLFTAILAVLDVILVLMIFKGDIRIS